MQFRRASVSEPIPAAGSLAAMAPEFKESEPILVGQTEASKLTFQRTVPIPPDCHIGPLSKPPQQGNCYRFGISWIIQEIINSRFPLISNFNNLNFITFFSLSLLRPEMVNTKRTIRPSAIPEKVLQPMMSGGGGHSNLWTINSQIQRPWYFQRLRQPHPGLTQNLHGR